MQKGETSDDIWKYLSLQQPLCQGRIQRKLKTIKTERSRTSGQWTVFLAACSSGDADSTEHSTFLPVRQHDNETVYSAQKQNGHSLQHRLLKNSDKTSSTGLWNVQVN